MIVLDLSILNQKGTPMFNSDLTANRPAAGIVGRIFIATDSPYGIFRDTGTAWDQISSAGGATIYTADGTLTGNRTVSSGGFSLTFTPQTTFFSSLTASTGASSFSVLGSNALTFAVGFSSSNIGNVYGANGAINAQNFLGNATFAQANLASAMVNVNKIDFGSGGHTITMTQSTAPGIRAMSGVQNQIQFTGSHNGTISHAAISQNLGFFRESGSTRTLTITNAYSLLINPLDDYGAGFTFTNRWGIYQAGASDKNYFAANSLFGTTVDAGYKVDIVGPFRANVAGNVLELRVNGFAYVSRMYFLNDYLYNSTNQPSLGIGPKMEMLSGTGINFSWVNNPKDKGGATRFGITERVARDHGYMGDMREFPRSLASQIYIKTYYVRPSFDEVALRSSAVAVALMDAGVLCGTARPSEWLQRLLNVLNREQKVYKDIATDGAIGHNTIAALGSFLDTRGQAGEKVLLTGINGLLVNHFVTISEGREANEEFTYGWLLNRTNIN